MSQREYDSYFNEADPDDGYGPNEESEAEDQTGAAQEGPGEAGEAGAGEATTQAATPSTYGSYVENERIRQLESRLEQQTQLFNQLLEQTYSAGGGARDTQAGTGLEDIDWDDPEELKKKLPQMIQSQTAQQMQQLQQQMQQAQYYQAQREAQRNEMALRQELEGMGMGDVFNEVQELIHQWGMSPEQLAQPNAYQSIAQYALGQREFRKRKNVGRRPPNLGGSGPSEQSQPRQRKSSLSDEDARVLEDLTSGRVDPEDIEFFNSRAQAGPVTMADFENFENNKSKRKK